MYMYILITMSIMIDDCTASFFEFMLLNIYIYIYKYIYNSRTPLSTLQ